MDVVDTDTPHGTCVAGTHGDGASRERLARDYDWLARSCARRFSGRGEGFDDLYQVARLGLIGAIDRYDPGRGSFEAFATVTMLGELRRHFRDTTWRMHVPRRVKDLQGGLRLAVEQLTHELHRPPRPEELAERLDISVDEVLEALDGAAAYRTQTLDRTDDGGRHSSGDNRGELAVELRMLIDQLPERERQIIVLRFYEGMSQHAIAHQLGISQMQVSRLLRSTLGLLRTRL